MSRLSDSLEKYVYLVNWVFALVLGLGFVFYFARLVAVVLTFTLRVVWKKFHVRISIGAIRLLPLGGRVTARNVVVSTQDYTISILRLNFTWRYWLLTMTRVAAYYVPLALAHGPDEPRLSAEKNESLPLSLKLVLDGFEVFLYNRTAAYDLIEQKLAQAAGDGSPKPLLGSESDHKERDLALDASSALLALVSHLDEPSRVLRFVLLVLPLQIIFKRGAFVLGNHTTPQVLVGAFRLGRAVLDLAPPASPLDRYRFRFDLAMTKFQVTFKPNVGYDPNKFDPDKAAAPARPHKHRLTALRNRFPFKRLRRAKPQRDQVQWHGLQRYATDAHRDRFVELLEIEEYAKYSLLLDSVSSSVSYYYDAPGSSSCQDSPPEAGLDIVLSLATIHYGSWADRQRGPLQSLLFPGLARDSVPTVYSDRRPLGFKVNIATNDQMIIRLPTREFSKDREELAKASAEQHTNMRPFGWIELKVAAGSSIRSFNSYIASADGWPNSLAVSFANLEARTSVTHDILFTAKLFDIAADIGLPLAWNGPCSWRFDIESTESKFFLMREHITLFTDVVADFASGAPVKYEYFRPLTYKINWAVRQYRVYFNVNDHNIVNDTLDFGSNKYLCFSGELLDIQTLIPLMGGFALSSKVDFDISTNHLDLSLEVPPWHTVSAFMEGSKRMGSTGAFAISGYYSYFQKIEVNRNNFVVIKATGDDVALLFHGYLIRYLFTLKENLFGDFTKFRTFEEYTLGAAADHASDVDNPLNGPDYWRQLKTENFLDVFFTFLVRRGVVVLPSHIYNHKNHISLCFSMLDVDIHVCKFYMDLQADFSPARGYYVDDMPDPELVFSATAYEDFVARLQPQASIEDFSVHTHRMLGVDNLTYHCKWDFACGSLRIDSDTQFIKSLSATLTNFALGFKDLENTLIYHIPTVYDAANYSFRCPEISVKIKTGLDDIYMHLELADLLVAFNDIANSRYSSRILVQMPSVTFNVVDGKSGSYHAYFQTSVTLTNFCQKADMAGHRKLQQEFIKRNDATTHRTAFLLFPDSKDEDYDEARGKVYPTCSLPSASVPLTREFDAIHSDDESSASWDGGFTQTSLEERQSLNKSHDVSDYRPKADPIPGFQHDSLILEVEPTNVVVTPTSIQALSSMLLGLQNTDPAFLIDRLQCESIKYLKKLIMGVPMVDNTRFVCDLLELKIVEHGLTSPTQIFQLSPHVPVLTLSVNDVSFVSSKKTLIARDGFILRVDKRSSMALHIQEIYASVYIPGHFSSALTLTVNELELWKTESPDEGVILSLKVMGSKLDVNAALQDYTISFVKILIERVQSALANMQKMNQLCNTWKGLLTYTLSKAAENQNFQSDPKVLTHPARILRSCEDHVRFYESWKLITKLRSIWSQLDSNSTLVTEMKAGKFEVPTSAMDYVLTTFKAWRPWEGDMEQREWFLRELFESATATSPGTKLGFGIGLLEINLSTNNDSSDYLALQKIDLEFCRGLQIDIPESTQASELEVLEQSVVLNVDACDIAISPVTLNLIPLLQDSAGATPQKESPAKSKQNTDMMISVLFNLNVLRLRLELLLTHLEQTVYGNTMAVQLSKHNGLYGVSVAMNNRDSVTSWGESSSLVSITTRDSQLVVASAGKQEATPTSIDLCVGNSDFKVTNEQNNLLVGLENLLNNDVKYVTEVMGTKPKKEVSEKPAEPFVPSIRLKLALQQFTFAFELLDPLRLYGTLSNFTTTYSGIITDHLLRSQFRNLKTEWKLLDVSILRTETVNFLSHNTMSKEGEFWLADISTSSEYFKTNVPLLQNSLDAALKNKDVLVKRVESLQSMMKQNHKPQTQLVATDLEVSAHQNKTKASFLSQVIFSVQFKQDYCGLSTFRNQCNYTFESEGVDVKLSNHDPRVDSGSFKLPIYGDIAIPAIRITVLDPGFSVGLSTLLEFNISAKASHDHSSAEESQSLQVESQYFRICLSAPVIHRVYDLANSVKHIMKKHADVIKPQEQIQAITPTEPLTSKPPYFSSIHLLSYNFCVGWIFGSHHKDYPGVILGAERIFAVTSKNIGKLTLMDGYLSVAHGASASTFYSKASEVYNLNRAFMPQVQTNYYVDNEQRLWLTVTGDELDVRCLPSTTVIIQRGMESVTELRGFFEKKAENVEASRNSAMALKSDKKTPTAPHKSSSRPRFVAVHCTTKFAGAKFFIDRLQDEDYGQAPSSLSLVSPAILSLVAYHHSHEASKKHLLKVEVLFSRSENIIDSSCIPVIFDIIDAFKSIFATDNVSERTAFRRSSETPKPASSNNFVGELGKTLKNLDFQAGIIVEKQKLSLSCEPKAKVAAIVQNEGLSILVCSGLEDYESLYVFAQLHPLSASLQHIYSEEGSGSLLLRSITFSSMISFRDGIEIFSTSSISDLSGSVKMKQYQDVDLFYDIWYPKKYRTRGGKQPVRRVKPTERSRVGFPVSLDIVINNVSLDVDFGHALGVMRLEVDSIWALSRRTANWYHEFRLGLHTLKIDLEGRLGGCVKLEDFSVNTAIEWELDDSSQLVVPLVQMSGLIGKFQLKAIFDEHIFAFGNIKALGADVYNRKNLENLSKDYLYVILRYETVEVFLTSLSISDFYDIHGTISRMIEEQQKSYSQNLQDSNKKPDTTRTYDNFLEVAKNLDTVIDVSIGVTVVQVFPHAFHDSRVFVIELDASRANFSQKEYTAGALNDIEMQLNNVKASFSATKGVEADVVKEMDVEQFSEYARLSKGGNLVDFPRFMINMRTIQPYDSNTVEYLFHSSFGGAVDIKWNLGSVNCVREMYAAHKRALQSRTEGMEFQREPFDLETGKVPELEDGIESAHKDIDKDIQQTMEKVSSRSKFTYVALAPPIIETPRLKELGSATPPLEWFGLHRNKFPNVTHQLAIVSLQKLIHLIEREYLEALKASQKSR